MKNQVEILIQSFQAKLELIKEFQAGIEFRNRWYKEHIVGWQNKLKTATLEVKKESGLYLNQLKQKIDEIFEAWKETWEINNFPIIRADFSIKNNMIQSAHPHWINDVIERSCEWFAQLNFQISQGNEIVDQRENFDLLNISHSHPSRKEADSFYYHDQKMLRTHNTANTAKVLLDNHDKKELRVATFGNVYRNDPDDATHTHQFTQIDFIWVQKEINLTNLKWVINNYLESIFEQPLKTRYRPSFFPFTETSFEVDLACVYCQASGCRICKYTGWIEVLGAGMLNPQCFINTGYDPTEYNAIAAGIGCERIAMIKHRISNIRDFYQNEDNFFKKGNWLC